MPETDSIAIKRSFFANDNESTSSSKPRKNRSNKKAEILKSTPFKLFALFMFAVIGTVLISVLLFFGGDDSEDTFETSIPVVYLNGRVSYENADSNGFVQVSEPLLINNESTIRTGVDGHAAVVIGEDSVILVDQSTQIKITSSEDNIVVNQISGSAFYVVGSSNSLQLETVNAEIISFESSFGIALNTDKDMSISVIDGSVDITDCVNSESRVVAGRFFQLIGSNGSCDTFEIATPDSVADTNWSRKGVTFASTVADISGDLYSSKATRLELESALKDNNEFMFQLDAEFNFDQVVLSAPVITVSEPVDGFTTDETTVTLKGFVDAWADLTVNEDSVLVSSDGSFELVLELEEGDNEVKIIAINPLSTETSEEMLTIVKAEEEVEEPVTGTLNVTSSVSDSGITIQWIVDNYDVSNGFRILRGLQPNPGQGSNPIEDDLVGSGVRSYEYAIADGGIYYFTVCIFDGSSCSVYSNSVQVQAFGSPDSFP